MGIREQSRSGDHPVITNPCAQTFDPWRHRRAPLAVERPERRPAELCRRRPPPGLAINAATAQSPAGADHELKLHVVVSGTDGVNTASAASPGPQPGTLPLASRNAGLRRPSSPSPFTATYTASAERRAAPAANAGTRATAAATRPCRLSHDHARLRRRRAITPSPSASPTTRRRAQPAASARSSTCRRRPMAPPFGQPLVETPASGTPASLGRQPGTRQRQRVDTVSAAKLAESPSAAPAPDWRLAGQRHALVRQQARFEPSS